MRIPCPWHHPLAAGRLLLLSTFPDSLRRPTAASRRNACVATLAHHILILHAALGGKTIPLPTGPRAQPIPPDDPSALSRARLPSSRHRPAPGPPSNTQTGRLRDQSPPPIDTQTRSNPAHLHNPKNQSSDNRTSAPVPAASLPSRKSQNPANPDSDNPRPLITAHQ